MVRFKVVRASHLLLGVAVVVLAVVLALLGFRLFSGRPETTVTGSASLVDAQNSDEAKTALVFASSGEKLGLPLDPGSAVIEIEVVSRVTEPPAEPVSVLIYHTHTHEAYEQVTEDPYEALEAWRTSDVDHSVVRVGE